MRSWDKSNGREGDTSPSLSSKELNCPHRVWFGKYLLHYCDIDKAICKDQTLCVKLLQKKKDE